MSRFEHLLRSTIFAVLLTLLVPLQYCKGIPIEFEFGINLIENPNAEDGVGSDNGKQVDVPGWIQDDYFTVVEYGTVIASGAFPDFDDPGPSDRGKNFFAGGETWLPTSAYQIIDISPANIVEIDEGTVSYELSGYLGGYFTKPDQATLIASFQNSSGGELGSATIGPVTQLDRFEFSGTWQTGLLLRDTQGFVPEGTRQIKITLTMDKADGGYNDGYADNLSLVLVPLPSTIILLGTGVLAMRRYHHISGRARRSPIKK